MKINYTIVCILMIIISFFTGCLLEEGFIDQNLQGEIQHLPYSFVSGYATDSFTDSSDWTFRLYNVAPQAGLEPYEDGAYPSGSYCYFTIPKNNSPQLYEVGTFGIGADIGVYATIGTTTNTAFDDGELEILTIDLSGGTITGKMWVDVSSVSEGSSLNGNFSVVIDPESIPVK
jgi:hypothetical protein